MNDELFKQFSIAMEQLADQKLLFERDMQSFAEQQNQQQQQWSHNPQRPQQQQQQPIPDIILQNLQLENFTNKKNRGFNGNLFCLHKK